MLYQKKLDKIIYNRYKHIDHDELDLVIISGYVGPGPIKKISEIPLHTTIVYGMYACNGISQALHNTLINDDNKFNNVDIYYSSFPVHSKLYMWRYQGVVIDALVGSANFSTNGLTNPFRETLAEPTYDTFSDLDNYIELVLSQAIRCRNGIASPTHKLDVTAEIYNPHICRIPLYATKNGEDFIPPSSGLNWGMASLNGSHVNPNDAYIRIPSRFLSYYPDLFPVKQLAPSNIESIPKTGHRNNDTIDIIWDDGTTMVGLLEGSQSCTIDGIKNIYPKQIATSPNKSKLGKYIRKRLGVPEGQLITLEDLDRYGRRTIDISLQGEGIYYLDFSV